MHIVLYVVDSLRADHLSCYGYNRNTTPNLDRIAEQGTRFESCYAPSTWTKPVSASIVSGWYPPAHGHERYDDVLPTQLPLLQEQLHNSGSQTALFTGIGHVSSATGYDRGFDEVVDVYKEREVLDSRTQSTSTEELLYAEEADIIAYPRAEDLHRYFLDWLSGNKSNDTFSLLWTIDPHTPYDPPPDAEWFIESGNEFGAPYRRQETQSEVTTEREFEHMKNLYDCEIKYWDSQFGNLLRELDRLGITKDERLIVVVGDHGQSFGDRKWIDSPIYKRPLRSHGNPPYDSQIHVPFILNGPDESAESVRDDLVSLIDITPTILKLAGAPTFRTQGEDVARTHLDRDAVFSRTIYNNMIYQGVRTADHKYIQMKREPQSLNDILRDIKGFTAAQAAHYMFPNESLYDLNVDPNESNNIARNNPSEKESYEDLLQKWLDECEQFNPGAVGTLTDEQTQDQIRALGYTE